MATDKYTAFWVSNSSISDFNKCPRLYYLKYLYKDPKTNHKIKIVNSFLSLGQAVHDSLDLISLLPTKERFKDSLLDKLDIAWKKVSGKKGGFENPEAEAIYKQRAEEMLRKIIINPGPLKNLAVKIKGDLPYYWLSEEDNIILCGKIDWMEYYPETDSVHIIDFKTSKNRENDESQQLPIYYLLASNCQKHPVSKTSYWYLELDNEPAEKALPALTEIKEKTLKSAKKIKLARQLEKLKCEHGGCDYCKPYEAIIKGEIEKIGTDERNCDLYIYPGQLSEDEENSFIL